MKIVSDDRKLKGLSETPLLVSFPYPSVPEGIEIMETGIIVDRFYLYGNRETGENPEVLRFHEVEKGKTADVRVKENIDFFMSVFHASEKKDFSAYKLISKLAKIIFPDHMDRSSYEKFSISNSDWVLLVPIGKSRVTWKSRILLETVLPAGTASFKLPVKMPRPYGT